MAERDDDCVVMVHRLHPQPGYPFALDLAITYSLSPTGLTVTTAATNVGTGACPYGAGAHPSVSDGGTPLVDDATLIVPANTWLSADDRGIPLGEQPVDNTPHTAAADGQPVGAGDPALAMIVMLGIGS